MKKRVLLLMPIIVFSMLASVESVSSNFSVYVSFNDAYYADLDNDGLQDDIRLDMTIELYNAYVLTNVELYIGITLPSGTEFWFVVIFDVYKTSYFFSTGMKFNAYNTAIESGWYDASAVGFAEGDSYSIMETITFDPPGGYSQGNPSAEATFY